MEHGRSATALERRTRAMRKASQAIPDAGLTAFVGCGWLCGREGEEGTPHLHFEEPFYRYPCSGVLLQALTDLAVNERALLARAVP